MFKWLKNEIIWYGLGKQKAAKLSLVLLNIILLSGLIIVIVKLFQGG